VSVDIGIGFAQRVVATNLGFLCKHRGAHEAAEVEVCHPLRSARSLFASRWFSIGVAVALVAGALHVIALALAPLSRVQAVIAGGLVLLAVMADRLFAHQVTPREWIAVLVSGAALAVLALVASARTGASSSFTAPALAPSCYRSSQSPHSSSSSPSASLIATGASSSDSRPGSSSG
jgi:hypothetical protein